MRCAQGPGIVRLHASHAFDDGPSRGILLVEERLVSLVSLREKMGCLSFTQMHVMLLRVLLDGLAALETLKLARVLHRDISPNNLLYSVAAQAWRLTDFDLACPLPAGSTQWMDEPKLGTLGYAAPESEAAGCYSFSSDLWGLGRTAVYLTEQVQREVWRRCDPPLDAYDLPARLHSIEHTSMLAVDPAVRSVQPSEANTWRTLHDRYDAVLRSEECKGPIIVSRIAARAHRTPQDSASELDVPLRVSS